jgi:sugar lactone lactonase YvrE
LFTDVVASTELAREMGDVGWSRLLAAQQRVVRACLKDRGGREVDTAGDGFFAVFDRPADAVRCAFDACRAVQELGLDIRAGVHVGEVELRGSEVHGIVVHTGARVMAQATGAQVVVTATVKDLVAGARFDLRERETVELKGVPGTWALYDVMAVDDVLRPAPIEGASVASERRDRVAAAPVRRRGRRWLVPVTAAVAVVAVAGAVAVTRPDPTFVPAAGTVVRITADGRFAEPVPMAPVPTGIAWGEGRIWVTDQQGQIYWFDPSTGVKGSRGAAGVPTGVVVGGGAVWVTNGFGVGAGASGGVTRIEPLGEALAPAFETPVGSEAIAWGADRIWVTDTATGDVRVYDPATRSTETVALPAGGSDASPRPEEISVTEGEGAAVWVGDAAQGRVFRMDATSPTDAEIFPVSSSVTGIAVGDGGVWVTGGEDDTVTLLDPSSGAVVTSIDVGRAGCNEPEAVAVATGAVWVGCTASRTLIRIEPGAAAVAGSLSLHGAPAQLTADEDGTVWVAVGPA